MAEEESMHLRDIFASLADIMLRQAVASTTMIQVITELSTSAPAVRPVVAQLAGELQVSAEQSATLTDMLAEAIRAGYVN